MLSNVQSGTVDMLAPACLVSCRHQERLTVVMYMEKKMATKRLAGASSSVCMHGAWQSHHRSQIDQISAAASHGGHVQQRVAPVHQRLPGAHREGVTDDVVLERLQQRQAKACYALVRVAAARQVHAPKHNARVSTRRRRLSRQQRRC